MNLQESTNDIIETYFNAGLQYNEILSFIRGLHGISMSIRTLKRRLKQMHCYRRRNYTNIDSLLTFLRNELQTSSQLHGYRWLHLKCLQNKFVVTQNTVRLLMHVLDPQGVDFRKRKRLRRRQYSSRGPNWLWHTDSYDKLKPYGITINGCIDGFSRHIMWLRTGQSSNNPRIIAGYYLDTIKHRGGCPRTIRADWGTENGHVEYMQTILKDVNRTDGSPDFMYGRSTANQRIESWWSILRKHNSQFWLNLFQTLKDGNNFDGSFLDKSLIQYCFMELIQVIYC